MEIVVAKNKESWNNFVKAHYPPVGAFMQTWEWGEFQAALGRKTERYEVREKDDVCAVFTLVHHALPLGLSYGYVPRGPVVSSSAIKEGKHIEIKELSGVIEHVGYLETKIKTSSGDVLYVPNSLLSK